MDAVDATTALDVTAAWVEPVVLTDSGVWSVVRSVPVTKDGGEAAMATRDKDERGNDNNNTRADDADSQDTQDSTDGAIDYIDSGSLSARRARAAKMPPAKREMIRLLSQFLRDRRNDAGLQQTDVRRLVQRHPSLPENMSQSYVPHIENLANDTQQSSDVGFFKLWAILRACKVTLADLERYLESGHARISPAQERREASLLAQFRLLSPARQQHALDLVNLVVADELRSDEAKLAELDAAVDLAADENNRPPRRNGSTR